MAKFPSSGGHPRDEDRIKPIACTVVKVKLSKFADVLDLFL